MDSYISLTGDAVKLGKKTTDSIDNPVYREILQFAADEAGGAIIKFEKMSDAAFSRLTKCFDNPVKCSDEGYIVEISDEITVYYTADISKVFALYAIKRHCTDEGIKRGIIYNTPKVPFRCLLSHLPGKKHIEEYKKLIDMLLAFGHNTLMVEVAGAMEYKRHPEISEGWVEYCKIFKEYNGKASYANKIHKFPKNSIAPENGRGEYLTHEELLDIVRYCRSRHMEIIPNVPTLSHAEYILFSHPELAECPDEPIPSNACPSNEAYYKIVFDIIDEVIEVFKPERINICHDEAYVFAQCPACEGKEPWKLFGNHIVRLHDYLKEKGIKTMMWGDGLIKGHYCGDEAVHVRQPWEGKTFTLYDKTYPIRNFKNYSIEEWAEFKKENPDAEGWYVPAKYKCIDMLPNDIEVMNWSWRLYPDAEKLFVEKGLYNVFGNFLATGMNNFDERIKNGVSGVSFSAWGSADFDSLQRTNAFFGLVYNSYACWNRNYRDINRKDNVFLSADAAYRHINYEVLRKKHLEITHTTDALIEHPAFFAYDVRHEDFEIGAYEILYTDGSSEEIPIYWGLNIGNSGINWGDGSEGTTVSVEEGGYASKYIFEPIGTCNLMYDGKKTWYTFVVPITKEVENVTVKSKDGYNITLKSAIVK